MYVNILLTLPLNDIRLIKFDDSHYFLEFGMFLTGQILGQIIWNYILSSTKNHPMLPLLIFS